MNSKVNFIAIIALVSAIFISSNASAQKTNTSLLQHSNPLINSLSNITQLHPISYQYNDEEAIRLNLPVGLKYGFNPDELQSILPGVVKTHHKMVSAGKNSFKTVATKDVDLISLIPLLVGSIKEQQTEIERLKAEMQLLKQELKK